MDKYVESLLELDRLTPDGTFTVPSLYPDGFDLRGAIKAVRELGRPLTDDEMKQYATKDY